MVTGQRSTAIRACQRGLEPAKGCPLPSKQNAHVRNETIDTFVIGPVDLSISLGVPFDYEGSVFQDAQAQLAAAARRAGKPAGIGVYRPAGDPESIQRAMDDGFSLILAGGDEPFLAAGCQQMAHVRADLGY